MMSLSDSARQQLIREVADRLNHAPPENEEAARRNSERCESYRRKYAAARALPTEKRQGLNMTLPAEVVGGETIACFGHVPGAKPGATYQDRGELYVAGVHATLMKGIHAPTYKSKDFGLGAYSIVLSGVYADDDDMGESFWYTGEGGMDSKTKRQVKDQCMDRGSNLALKNNCTSKTPVRVIRGYLCKVGEGSGTAAAAAAADDPGGSGNGANANNGADATGSNKKEKREKRFVYEGLYVVLEYKEEPSKDGPKVCRFLLHGVPGHSTVNTKVEYGIFGGVAVRGALHARRLASADPDISRPQAKRLRIDKGSKTRQTMLADIRTRYGSSGLLVEDISGGQEPVPIPLINEVNTETLPSDFQYIKEYAWAPGVYDLVRPVLRVMDEEMAEFTRKLTCGLAFNRHIAALDRAMGSELPEGYAPHQEEQYNRSGCLLITDPCGVHECGNTCTASRCRQNKQLTNGVYLPLEVFMTEMKGWGVRCREDIPAGAFVCTYVGQLMTDHMADMRKGVDHYLFNLDFFTHIYQEINEKGLEAVAAEIPIHKIPPVLPISAVRELQRLTAMAVRRQIGAADAATSGASPDEPDDIPAAILSTLLEPEKIKEAARALASSCRVVAAASASQSQGQGVSGSRDDGTARRQTTSSVVGTVEKTLAQCDNDLGAFFLQPIFGRDEPESAEDGGGGVDGATTSAGARAQMAQGEEYATILALDALHMGNIGRFINHSCEGNLTIQAVFGGPYRNTFLYHVGLYACEDIPAMTELTYNYGYHSQQANRGDTKYGMECHCGAPNCKGQLL